MTYVAPVQTVSEIVPGFGTPSWPPFQALNQALNPSATIVIPSSGTLTFNGAAVTMKKGWIRVRISNITGTPTYSVLVQGTDGTLTSTFASIAASAAQSTTTVIEYLFPFYSELLLNKFTITITGSATTATADVEVAGNP